MTQFPVPLTENSPSPRVTWSQLPLTLENVTAELSVFVVDAVTIKFGPGQTAVVGPPNVIVAGILLMTKSPADAPVRELKSVVSVGAKSASTGYVPAFVGA